MKRAKMFSRGRGVSTSSPYRSRSMAERFGYRRSSPGKQLGVAEMIDELVWRTERLRQEAITDGMSFDALAKAVNKLGRAVFGTDIVGWRESSATTEQP